MTKSIYQDYVCIIKSSKFGSYSHIIRKGSNSTSIAYRLRGEGYRVLIALSYESLIRLQTLPKYDYPNSILKGWTKEAIDYMKNIPVYQQ